MILLSSVVVSAANDLLAEVSTIVVPPLGGKTNVSRPPKGGTTNTKALSRHCVVGILITLSTIALQSSIRAQQSNATEQAERIRRIVLSRGDDPAALAHLIQLANELEPAGAAELFVQLADDHFRNGNFNLAGDILRQMVEQYSDQPAASSGLITLVQLFSSSEVAYFQHTGPDPVDKQAFAVYGLYLAEQAIQKQRQLADDPALAFQCAVAARLSGKPRVAKSWLTPLKHNPRNQTWHQCALVEEWLASTRDDTPPKPAVICSRCKERPHLDAALDEPLWKAAAPLQLSMQEQSSPVVSTDIRLACDEEFLYVAVHCQKLSGVEYVDDQLPRSHDTDLAGHDRVRLQLDLDRDYATSYELSVDHRGQTADVCWRDSEWNPHWYVAANQDATSWTIEAAIPWSELTDTPPAAGEAWALAVDRRAPTETGQSWAGSPAEESGSDRFGLLLFD